MFSENLKRLRKERGFTQESLAIQLHVVRQTVSKWEKGLSVPDAVMLQRLAEVLEVSVSELLGAEIPTGESQRNEIAELLSKINEQLAIRNRRGRLVLRIVLIVLAVLIVLPILSAALFGLHAEENQIDGSVRWLCTLDEYIYEYQVDYNARGKIVSGAMGWNVEAPDAPNADNYSTVEELEAALEDYFQSRGGTVERVENADEPLHAQTGFNRTVIG